MFNDINGGVQCQSSEKNISRNERTSTTPFLHLIYTEIIFMINVNYYAKLTFLLMRHTRKKNLFQKAKTMGEVIVLFL